MPLCLCALLRMSLHLPALLRATPHPMPESRPLEACECYAQLSRLPHVLVPQDSHHKGRAMSCNSPSQLLSFCSFFFSFFVYSRSCALCFSLRLASIPVLSLVYCHNGLLPLCLDCIHQFYMSFRVRSSRSCHALSINSQPTFLSCSVFVLPLFLSCFLV